MHTHNYIADTFIKKLKEILTSKREKQPTTNNKIILTCCIFFSSSFNQLLVFFLLYFIMILRLKRRRLTYDVVFVPKTTLLVILFLENCSSLMKSLISTHTTHTHESLFNVKIDKYAIILYFIIK